MKIREKELEEIEAALLRYKNTGVQFYPAAFKEANEGGFWQVWLSDEIDYTHYGPYDEKKADYKFEKDVSREELLDFLGKTDVAAEWEWDDRQTDYQKFAREYQIFPLEEIRFELPRPLATKFKKTFLHDKAKLQKYILDSIIEAIKDNAENYIYSE